MVKDLMRKHGLKSAAKRDRLLAAAEDEADEALDKKVQLHFTSRSPASEILCPLYIKSS